MKTILGWKKEKAEKRKQKAINRANHKEFTYCRRYNNYYYKDAIIIEPVTEIVDGMYRMMTSAIIRYAMGTVNVSAADLTKALINIAIKYNCDEQFKLIAYTYRVNYLFQYLRNYTTTLSVLANKGANNPILISLANIIEIRSIESYVGSQVFNDWRQCTTEEDATTWANTFYDFMQSEIKALNGIQHLALTNAAMLKASIRAEAFNDTKDALDTANAGLNRTAETRKILRQTELTSLAEYEAIKNSMIGGYCFTNEKYLGKHITGTIKCKDIASSYLHEQLTKMYPMQLIAEKHGKDCLTEAQARELANGIWSYEDADNVTRQTPAIAYMEIEFTKGLRVNKYNQMWMTLDHLDNTAQDDAIPDFSGQRLKESYKCRFWINSIDLKTLLKTYQIKGWMEILNAYIYRADVLPSYILKPVVEAYKIKSTNKISNPIKSKQAKLKVASSYGICAQDIMQKPAAWDIEKGWMVESMTEERKQEMLNAYNDNPYRIICYQWGACVSAYARQRLINTIISIQDATGDSITTDTDSIYYLDNDEVNATFDKINRVNEQQLNAIINYRRNNKMWAPSFEDIAPVDESTGKCRVLGNFEDDGTYIEMKSLHAKAHLFKKQDGTYKLTLGGTPNKAALDYIVAQNSNPFDTFKNTLCIPESKTNKVVEVPYEAIDHAGKKWYVIKTINVAFDCSQVFL